MKQNGKLFIYWNEHSQGWIAVCCCLAMVAGLFFSRALLSVSMILMLLNAFHPGNIRDNFQAWYKNAFSWLGFAFFGVYLLSGLWSSDTDFWWASTINKLPFVILPFAFLSVPLHKIKYQRIIIIGIAVMQLLVILYSLLQLGLHTEFYMRGYHVSRPLPTTKYDDHIRFSLSLVLSIQMFCYLLFEQQKATLTKAIKIFLIACILLFVVYLHILAAKTGLICLYLSTIVFIFYKVYGKSKIKAVVLALCVAAIPVVAYNIIPTFKTKVDYVFYEFNKSKQDKKYDYTLSDAGRMITYDIGLKAIEKYPFTGTGAGDIMHEMRAGYQQYYPEVASSEQYGPTNQFMFTALSVGIPLCLVLVAMILYPFFARRKNVYLVITGMVMLVSMMVEAMLELQFGVFTYLFFILFWIAAIKADRKNNTIEYNDVGNA